MHALRGEAVVDDTQLFDGEVAGVRIEPTQAMPGLRARSSGRAGGAGWPVGPLSSAPPAHWWSATACTRHNLSADRRFIATREGWLLVR